MLDRIAAKLGNFIRSCQARRWGPSFIKVIRIGFEREKVGQLEQSEPIVPFRPWGSGPQPEASEARGHASRRADHIAFDRKELNIILGVYGTRVAAGEWRDYALDFGRDKATFSIFRRASEMPLYRIVKDPTLARRQGLYAVIAQGGLILKRGQDLAQVLRVLIRHPQIAAV